MRPTTPALRLFGRAVLFAASVLISGCGDPVRTTLQPVRLKVTNASSGAAVADAHVSLKYEFDYYTPKPDEWNAWKRDTYRWFSGRTDSAGVANIGVKWTAIDRTIGPNPPPSRDNVTGVAYVIRAQKDQVSEQHSMVLQPGASVKGDAFDIQVVEIQKPYYVKTDK